MNYLLHKCNKDDERSSTLTPSRLSTALTFAAVSGDLSEGVVAAVALASDHAGLALALAAVAVTRSGEGAERVAVTQQTALAALGTVVVVLDANAEEELSDRSSNQPLYHITALRVTTATFGNFW